MSLSPEFDGTLTRKSTWKPLFTSILAPLAVVLLIACGSGPVARSHNAPSPSASPSPSPSPSLALTNFTVAPVEGSGVTGSGTVDRSREPVALTATVSGLTPGRTYLIDADPLSCFFFVGGPSQSFAARLAPDSAGNARAAWDVPRSMTGNVNVQVLTAGGTFAVVACTDLHS